MTADEILSQDEIDALLTAISSGDTAPSSGGGGGGSAAAPTGGESFASQAPARQERHRKIKIYDFKRPDKFSKDQIRTLQMIHESFARQATTTLSAGLRTLVHVHVGTVDQLTYDEFIKSILNPTMLAVLGFSPLKGNAVIEFDPAITFAMIDRAFGGRGAPTQLNRELTDIEQAVMVRSIKELLKNIKDAWGNVVDLEPTLLSTESNPQFVQIVPPNDMVVLVTLEMRIGEVEGLANLCIPYITIEPIIAKLSAQFWFTAIRRGVSTEMVDSVRKRLAKTPLEISVVLGEAEIRMGELLALAPGDVVKLGTSVQSDAKLSLGGREKFNCRIGTVGKKLAAEITGLVTDVYSDDLVAPRGRKGEYHG